MKVYALETDNIKNKHRIVRKFKKKFRKKKYIFLYHIFYESITFQFSFFSITTSYISLYFHILQVSFLIFKVVFSLVLFHLLLKEIHLQFDFYSKLTMILIIILLNPMSNFFCMTCVHKVNMFVVHQNVTVINILHNKIPRLFFIVNCAFKVQFTLHAQLLHINLT